ncbi:hypothetical protein [Wolbachia endosymbiont of Aedes albopictus]|uniref:hypothetical protein n=1 Tax=Wolbachia endosymbiont of Aedes albopictus TaxID=167957 RepID=UPI00216A2238|nr:hypothetical protein [Wolbachia endosymbiont of Aedes albopictus]UVW83408.1 hypothetical protein NHG98_03375 [Wolbachia endosymbiont of Aedes albopictus]
MLDVISSNSSSAVGNPVDSTEDGTSSLSLLFTTLVSIVFMTCGLNRIFVGPGRDYRGRYYP